MDKNVENRLLVLTLISSYLDKDMFQYEAVRSQLDSEEIIQELLRISVILAGSIACSADENPKEVQLSSEDVLKVLETLRRISTEK